VKITTVKLDPQIFQEKGGKRGSSSPSISKKERREERKEEAVSDGPGKYATLGEKKGSILPSSRRGRDHSGLKSRCSTKISRRRRRKKVSFFFGGGGKKARRSTSCWGSVRQWSRAGGKGYLLHKKGKKSAQTSCGAGDRS